MAKGPLKAAYLKAVAGREQAPEPEAFERSLAEFKVGADVWPRMEASPSAPSSTRTGR
jgi:hypothetical protein